MSLAAASLVVLAGIAHAETTPPEGAPFCSDKDHLQEFLLAAMKHDKQWLDQLDDCAMIKGGLKYEVIEPGDGQKGMHVDKVRVFGTGGSAVGYTFVIDK